MNIIIQIQGHEILLDNPKPLGYALFYVYVFECSVMQINEREDIKNE